MRPLRAMEDKNMKNENRNEEAVSPVIATILMVAIAVDFGRVYCYVQASQLAERNTFFSGDFSMYDFEVRDASATAGSDRWRRQHRLRLS